MDTPFFHIFLSLRGYLLSKSSYLKKKLLFLWIVICDPTYVHCRGGLMSPFFFYNSIRLTLNSDHVLTSFHVFKLLVKPKPTTPITQIFSRLASVSVSLVCCIIWAHFWCAQYVFIVPQSFENPHIFRLYLAYCIIYYAMFWFSQSAILVLTRLFC